MRPRGKRNSVRIQALERRIARAEARLGIPVEQPPPQPEEADQIEPRLYALEARLGAIDAKLVRLLDELAKLRQPPPPATVPASPPPPSPSP